MWIDGRKGGCEYSTYEHFKEPDNGRTGGQIKIGGDISEKILIN